MAKDSMAIAYAMKKKAKRKDKNNTKEGGSANSGKNRRENEQGVNTQPIWQPEPGKSYAGTAARAAHTSRNDDERHFQKSVAKEEHGRVLDKMRSMKKPNLYAEGGEIQTGVDAAPVQQEAAQPIEASNSKPVTPVEPPDFHAPDSYDSSAVAAEPTPTFAANNAGAQALAEGAASMLSAGQSDKKEGGGGGPMSMLSMLGMAVGGLVEKAMAKRYSKGGMVANGGDADPRKMAGSKPANYDDLALRDTLESHYGDDDNSGDDLGDKREAADRHDIVSRIMKSRAKKDRMPRPA